MGFEKQYIAVDLGAESGRVMLGTVSESKVKLEEVYRFVNGAAKEDECLRWDFRVFFSEIKKGIGKAIKQSKGLIDGIGVDSWGVDYGLIGEDGALLENPYHYRDSRTDGILEKAFELMDKRNIYNHTGIQFMQINTVYQLLSTHLYNPDLLSRAKNLVFMADLVSYYLCGRVCAEYTLASTSGLMDMRTGQWSEEVFKNLSLPIEIMPKVVQSGTVLGKLKKEICNELGCEPIDVIAVGSHDTADAVAAVPTTNDKWAYLSSGTWSLMGIECPEAVINEMTFEHQFTNEGGVEGTILLLKNIMGLWVLQECRRDWENKGEKLTYAELTCLAEKARPFEAYIDPDHTGFLSPGDMPNRVNEYLSGIGAKPITEKGQIVRAILESLAMKYRSVAQAVERITQESIDTLHIVGGGIKNELLCQFAANATGKRIITGPIEAATTGNVLMQARATGQIDTADRAREIVRNSFELKEYLPQDTKLWETHYQKIIKR
ncbi:MAG: rhamnulokinase [Planctomycetota bacterium]|jgi:rhamnulokinase